MKLRSLRSRLLMASILWTCGLLFLAHMTAVIVIHATGPLQMSRVAFRTTFALFTLLSLIAMMVGFRMVRKALASFDELRASLGSVRTGAERTLTGQYPSEVAPLVDDLNALLDHHEQQVARAASRAGDLAHGLKTPLAVLSHDASRARASGHREVGDSIEQQVDRMRRQVEYHLAHARAAASGATPGTRCELRESAEALARTLARLHAERGIRITVDVAPDHSVRAERQDVDEMLGNLLDNACKWSKGEVRISSAVDANALVIDVDDDGPGLAQQLREQVLKRGVRADQAAPGSGLGLAIVREMAELYGGVVTLDDSPIGGLRARLRLPTKSEE